MSIEDAMKEFEKHTARMTIILDKVSDKIREVEGFLQKTGYNYPFKWNIPGEDAFFLWQRGLDKKTFRLMFKSGKFRGSRPFIEQKGDIRIKYVAFLEYFIRDLQESIKIPS